MFTGLIRDVGTIRSIERPTSQDSVFTIETTLPARDLAKGASIACDGVCLTVTDYKDGAFTVQAAAETCAVTLACAWAVGTHVNLEPSLRAGDAMGGHIVLGHVDGIAEIRSVEAKGEGHEIFVQPPPDLMKYMAPKGSVALNGVSLTVNEVDDTRFSVLIIPHTWENTNFSGLKEKDHVHIEVDPIARYTERLLAARTQA